VPVHQSQLLFDGLAARGVDVTLCLAEGLGHGFLNRQQFGAQGAGPTLVTRADGGVAGEPRTDPPIGFHTIKAFFDRTLAR
jgi:hypothetical protein